MGWKKSGGNIRDVLISCAFECLRYVSKKSVNGAHNAIAMFICAVSFYKVSFILRWMISNDIAPSSVCSCSHGIVGKHVSNCYISTLMLALLHDNESRVYLFCVHLSFTHDKSNVNLTVNDGVLGTRTRGCRMVGADEHSELWRHSI